MEITPFDLAGSLQAHNQLVQQQRSQDTQNAFAKALPMLQTDPQNALAIVGQSGNIDAYSKFSSIISQADEQKKAKLADRTSALAKAAMTVQQYKDPVIRKAVAMSMLPDLAPHGITADDIQRGDWSDNGVNTLTNMSRTVDQIISQQNTDRAFNAGRSDHADTLKQQDRAYNLQAAEFGEKKRHDQVSEAQDGGEAGGGLNDAAKINAAVKYNLTGTLPSFGMGKAARQDRLEVMNYAAELAKGKKPEHLVADAANFKANSASLNQITKQFNIIEQNSNSAKNSAALALKSAEAGGAGPTGSPALNRWIQAGRRNIAGDKNVMALDGHLSTFAEEYAKVMTASTGSAAATDSARGEAHKRLSSANSVGQLQSIFSEMLKEMGGRHYAARTQIQSIQGQLGGGSYSEQNGVQAKPDAPAAAPVSSAGWSNFKVHN